MVRFLLLNTIIYRTTSATKLICNFDPNPSYENYPYIDDLNKWSAQGGILTNIGGYFDDRLVGLTCIKLDL